MSGKPRPVGDITQQSLREILDYDRDTGAFRWRVFRTGSAAPGDEAGTINSEGYRRIQIEGVMYQASHLAWLYETGEWPLEQVDHENRNQSDDRYDNLRLASQTLNKANSGVYKNNKLGVKGVRLHRNGQYEARLRVRGKLQYLGCYRTLDEAKAAYDRASVAAFGEFASRG
jgi:hypothetical protein